MVLSFPLKLFIAMNETFSSPELWKITFLVLSGIALLLSSWVLTQALFPKFIRQAQEAYDRVWVNLAVGVATAVVGGIATTICASLAGKLTSLGPVGGLLGVAPALLGGVALAALVMVALGGSAGLARRVGSGMQHPTDKDQPWRRTFRGGVVLGGLLLVPILDIVPFALIILLGLGAGVRTLRKIRQEQRASGSSASSDD